MSLVLFCFDNKCHDASTVKGPIQIFEIIANKTNNFSFHFLYFFLQAFSLWESEYFHDLLSCVFEVHCTMRMTSGIRYNCMASFQCGLLSAFARTLCWRILYHIDHTFGSSVSREYFWCAFAYCCLCWISFHKNHNDMVWFGNGCGHVWRSCFLMWRDKDNADIEIVSLRVFDDDYIMRW